MPGLPPDPPILPDTQVRPPGALGLWLSIACLLGLSACTAMPPLPPPATPSQQPVASTGPTPAARVSRVPSAGPPAFAPAADTATTEPAAQQPPPPAQDVAQAPDDGDEIDRGPVSWYGKRFHGRRTASGETFNMHEMTAAHRSLPFGTRVRVRSLDTGREVVVRINDRGPMKRSRVLDISLGAARALGVQHLGVSDMVLLRE